MRVCIIFRNLAAAAVLWASQQEPGPHGRVNGCPARPHALHSVPALDEGQNRPLSEYQMAVQRRLEMVDSLRPGGFPDSCSILRKVCTYPRAHTVHRITQVAQPLTFIGPPGFRVRPIP